MPAGVSDGQKIRLAGKGEAGLRGAPSGDLFVTIRVKPDKVFGRNGDDLTLTVPVSYGELVLGTTRFRADPGRPCRREGSGREPRTAAFCGFAAAASPSVPAEPATCWSPSRSSVPQKLDDPAIEALKTYLEAEKASGFDPTGRVGRCLMTERPQDQRERRSILTPRSS